MNAKKTRLITTALLVSLSLAGCASIDVHPGASLSSGKRWILLPILNFSDTPKAGENAQALLMNRLRETGLPRIGNYVEQEKEGELPELNESKRENEAIAWSKQQGYAYALGGAVNEWRYKSGTGEPAVGLTLKVVDLEKGTVVWSATGARSGWAISTVSGTAQKLLGQMVSKINFE